MLAQAIVSLAHAAFHAGRQQAIAGLDDRYAALRELVTAHANDEQYDFRILFDDYRRAGGPVARIEDLRRNPGGEALNAPVTSRPFTFPATLSCGRL